MVKDGLSATRLSTAIQTAIPIAIKVAFPSMVSTDIPTQNSIDNSLANFSKVIADAVSAAVIKEFQDHADIEVTMLAHIHSGVQTGPGFSGPPVTSPTDPQSPDESGGIT